MPQLLVQSILLSLIFSQRGSDKPFGGTMPQSNQYLSRIYTHYEFLNFGISTTVQCNWYTIYIVHTQYSEKVSTRAFSLLIRKYLRIFAKPSASGGFVDKQSFFISSPNIMYRQCQNWGWMQRRTLDLLSCLRINWQNLVIYFLHPMGV